jgi:hypothetical protein
MGGSLLSCLAVCFIEIECWEGQLVVVGVRGELRDAPVESVLAKPGLLCDDGACDLKLVDRITILSIALLPFI